jgi:hypothetical protein
LRLSPDDYRTASLERVADARTLYEARHFSSALYLAGVAVACILRAYRTREDPAFGSRHDLAELLRASGLASFIPRQRREELSVALTEVWARWKNGYR